MEDVPKKPKKLDSTEDQKREKNQRRLESLGELAGDVADTTIEAASATVKVAGTTAKWIGHLAPVIVPIALIGATVYGVKYCAGKAADEVEKGVKGIETTVKKIGPGIEKKVSEGAGKAGKYAKSRWDDFRKWAGGLLHKDSDDVEAAAKYLVQFSKRNCQEPIYDAKGKKGVLYINRRGVSNTGQVTQDSLMFSLGGKKYLDRKGDGTLDTVIHCSKNSCSKEETVSTVHRKTYGDLVLTAQRRFKDGRKAVERSGRCLLPVQRYKGER